MQISISHYLKDIKILFDFPFHYKRISKEQIKVEYTELLYNVNSFTQITSRGMSVDEEIILKAFLTEFIPLHTLKTYQDNSTLERNDFVKLLFGKHAQFYDLSATWGDMPASFVVSFNKNYSLSFVENTCKLINADTTYTLMTEQTPHYYAIKSVFSLLPNVSRYNEKIESRILFVQDEQGRLRELCDNDIIEIMRVFEGLARQLYKPPERKPNTPMMTIDEEIRYYYAFPVFKEMKFNPIDIRISSTSVHMSSAIDTNFRSSDVGTVMKFMPMQNELVETQKWFLQLQQLRVSSGFVRLRNVDTELIDKTVKELLLHFKISFEDQQVLAEMVTICDGTGGITCTNPFKVFKPDNTEGQLLGYVKLQKKLITILADSEPSNILIDRYKERRVFLDNEARKETMIDEYIKKHPEEKNISKIKVWDKLKTEYFPRKKSDITTEDIHELFVLHGKMKLQLIEMIKNEKIMPIFSNSYSISPTVNIKASDQSYHTTYVTKTMPSHKILWSIHKYDDKHMISVYEQFVDYTVEPLYNGITSYGSFGKSTEQFNAFIHIDTYITKYTKEIAPCKPETATHDMGAIEESNIHVNANGNLTVYIQTSRGIKALIFPVSNIVTLVVGTAVYNVPLSRALLFTHILKLGSPENKQKKLYFLIVPDGQIHSHLSINPQFDEHSHDIIKSSISMKTAFLSMPFAPSPIAEHVRNLLPTRHYVPKASFEGIQLEEGVYYELPLKRIHIIKQKKKWPIPTKAVPWISDIVYSHDIPLFVKTQTYILKEPVLHMDHPSPGSVYNPETNDYISYASPIDINHFSLHTPIHNDQNGNISIDGKEYHHKHSYLYVADTSYYFICKITPHYAIKRQINMMKRKLPIDEELKGIINGTTTKYFVVRLPCVNPLELPHEMIQMVTKEILSYVFPGDTVLGEHSSLTNETRNPRDLALISSEKEVDLQYYVNHDDQWNMLQRNKDILNKKLRKFPDFRNIELMQDKYVIEYEIKTSANENRALTNYAAKNYHSLMMPIIGSPNGLKTMSFPFSIGELSAALIEEFKFRFSSKELYRGFIGFTFYQDNLQILLRDNTSHPSTICKTELPSLKDYGDSIKSNAAKAFTTTTDERQSSISEYMDESEIIYYIDEVDRQRIVRESIIRGDNIWMHRMLPVGLKKLSVKTEKTAEAEVSFAFESLKMKLLPADDEELYERDLQYLEDPGPQRVQSSMSHEEAKTLLRKLMSTQVTDVINEKLSYIATHIDNVDGSNTESEDNEIPYEDKEQIPKEIVNNDEYKLNFHDLPYFTYDYYFTHLPFEIGPYTEEYTIADLILDQVDMFHAIYPDALNAGVWDREGPAMDHTRIPVIKKIFDDSGLSMPEFDPEYAFYDHY